MRQMELSLEEHCNKYEKDSIIVGLLQLSRTQPMRASAKNQAALSGREFEMLCNICIYRCTFEFIKESQGALRVSEIKQEKR